MKQNIVQTVLKYNVILNLRLYVYVYTTNTQL